MNLAQSLRDSAHRHPDKAALLYSGRTITYAELDERVDAAATGLRDLGLQPATGPGEDGAGDRVAIIVGNAPAFVEALYGTLRAGLVAVPINIALAPAEIAHVLGDAGVRAIVVAEPFLGAIDGLRSTLPGLDHVIVTGASSPPGGTVTWRQLLDRAGELEETSITEDVVAVLQYTSGTTGRPRGARLTHGNLSANHRQLGGTKIGMEPDDIVLAVLPLFHIYALNVALAYTLTKGATVLLVGRFDPVATLQEVADSGATILIGAPPMFVAWANTPGLGDLDLSRVRFAISGAAPLPVEVLHRFSESLGVSIWEGYGLSETSPVLTTVAMDDAPRPGSVGRPLPEVEIRLIGEDGSPVREGDPGEVVARGPNVFSGYWRDPRASEEVIDEDGWFRTGDVGIVNDGHLHLVDRKKDLIIVSGFNVYPREVEEVLYSHPKVAQAAVIGAPHPYTGECVKAVVVLNPGEEADADALHAHCATRLARFKCPEVFEFVEELPLLASGKVRRRDLRDAS